MALSEDDLIASCFAPIAGEAGLGLKDDAALLAPRPGETLVLTKDMIVAGVHFFPDDPPDAIARKALRVNLSDLAAKAAEPQGFLLGLALPDGWSEAWLRAFADGLGEDSRRYRCPLIGGDTVRTPGPLTVCVTAIGSAPHMVRRGAVAAGDLLFVSGSIGDAALGLLLRLERLQDRGWIDALDADERAFLAERYLLPRPRLDLRQALRANASAAMDISDGFAGDLAKMLALTGLTAQIALADLPLSRAARRALELEPRLIETICGGGDDYEILCAAAPERSGALAAAAREAGVALALIGRAEPGAGPPQLRQQDGSCLELARASYGHF